MENLLTSEVMSVKLAQTIPKTNLQIFNLQIFKPSDALWNNHQAIFRWKN